MKTIRVFPRRTSMTPIDENVRINSEPGFFDEADEVHVSCLFSYDRERAQQLADAWSKSGFNVKLGGVAYGVADRVERLRAIGNGQVPLVAARAFALLLGRLKA